MDKEKELEKRIFHLENAIKSALKISDLWLPNSDFIEEHAHEYRAINTMYRLFKRLVKE